MLARPALLAARLFATAVLLAAAGAAAAQAGRVVLAVGEVAVQRGAERLRISAGVDVSSGDTVFTGAQSHAQIRFADNQLPASAPCSCNASSAYAEQLGVKRQPAYDPNKKLFAGDSVQR